MDEINKMLVQETCKLALPPIINLFSNQLKKLKKSIEFDETAYSKSFGKYLKRRYKKFTSIDTILFKGKKFNDIYTPLTIREIGKGKIEFKCDSFNEEFFSTHKNILIKDYAGMGKSTITKKLFMSIIEEKIERIPIFIELRKLSKKQNLLKEITSELSEIGYALEESILYEVISKGEFVFFLDGYDEILLSEKESVTIDIENFIERCDNNLFIMTSRPEDGLNSFTQFFNFRINSLKKEEAYNLLKRYDSDGDVSEELIKKIKEESISIKLEEFLENPLMVSLLYKCYDHSANIPYKKSLFYSQVYKALFEEHDISKGGRFIREKKSKLDIIDFEFVLRNLAARHFKLGKLDYSKEEIIKEIEQIKKESFKLDFKPNNFFYDITNTVPFLCKDGQSYKWLHKSFIEYFTASFISNNLEIKEKVIKKFAFDSDFDKYVNILDFFYDIDYESFTKVVFKPFLEEFIFFMEEDLDAVNMDPEYNRRKSFLFYGQIFLGNYNNLIKRKTELPYKELIINKINKIKNDDHLLHDPKASSFYLSEHYGIKRNDIYFKVNQGRFIILEGEKNISLANFIFNKGEDLFQNVIKWIKSNDDDNSYTLDFSQFKRSEQEIFNLVSEINKKILESDLLELTTEYKKDFIDNDYLSWEFDRWIPSLDYNKIKKKLSILNEKITEMEKRDNLFF